MVDPASAKLSVDGTLVTASVVNRPRPRRSRTRAPWPFCRDRRTIKVEGKFASGANFTLESSFTLPKTVLSSDRPGRPVQHGRELGIPSNLEHRTRGRARLGGGNCAGGKSAGVRRQDSRRGRPFDQFRRDDQSGIGRLHPGRPASPRRIAGAHGKRFRHRRPCESQNPATRRLDDWCSQRRRIWPALQRRDLCQCQRQRRARRQFPEYIVFQTNTGDSNTRGVLRNLAAGDYEIEFIAWERVGRRISRFMPRRAPSGRRRDRPVAIDRRDGACRSSLRSKADGPRLVESERPVDHRLCLTAARRRAPTPGKLGLENLAECPHGDVSKPVATAFAFP